MVTKVYQRLVRDCIPEIIEADGKSCVACLFIVSDRGEGGRFYQFFRTCQLVQRRYLVEDLTEKADRGAHLVIYGRGQCSGVPQVREACGDDQRAAAVNHVIDLLQTILYPVLHPEVIQNRSAQQRFFLFCRWADTFLIIELPAVYAGQKLEHTTQTMRYCEQLEYHYLLLPFSCSQFAGP